MQKMVSDEVILQAIAEVNVGHRRKTDGTLNKTVQWVENTKEERVKELRQFALDKSFQFHKPRQFTIYDTCAGKERVISEPRLYPDQYLHHMAIIVFIPITMKHMDAFCCGSITGRGSSYGRKAIRNWISNHPHQTKWVVEADIYHFYDSLKTEVVMNRLRQLIKDRAYLEFIERMLAYGIFIGAYFSQWFANTVLQPLDKALRKSKISRYIRYIDNFTIFGKNKKIMHEAIVIINSELNKMNLRLKGNWQMFQIENRLVSALGYRYARNYTLIRKKNLLRLKRQLVKYYKILAEGGEISNKFASGLICRIGLLGSSKKHRERKCNSYNIRKKYIRNGTLKQLKSVVREWQRSRNDELQFRTA